MLMHTNEFCVFLLYDSWKSSHWTEPLLLLCIVNVNTKSHHLKQTSLNASQSHSSFCWIWHTQKFNENKIDCHHSDRTDIEWTVRSYGYHLCCHSQIHSAHFLISLLEQWIWADCSARFSADDTELFWLWLSECITEVFLDCSDHHQDCRSTELS